MYTGFHDYEKWGSTGIYTEFMCVLRMYCKYFARRKATFLSLKEGETLDWTEKHESRNHSRIYRERERSASIQSHLLNQSSDSCASLLQSLHKHNIMLSNVNALKAKSISKYISEATTSEAAPDAGAFDTVWPEKFENTSNQENGDAEVDLYGYGHVSPTPKKPSVSNKLPRRSSLKSQTSAPVHRRASIGYTGEMVLTLPTGEQKKKRSSISFQESENVIEIKPLTNLVDDPNRLWFNQTELLHIKQDVVGLLKELKEKKKSDDETRSWICTRGLEPLVFGTSGSRLESTESVLEEYAVQRARGEYNDDHIREMYCFHTIDSQIEANERGEHDAKEIEPDLKLSRKQYRRASC